MSIESLGLNRPGGPMRPQRTERRERREAVVPRGKSFDAAEVRGGKPPVRQGTEEVLGKLHERGLLTNVSRPLGPDGQPIQSDGRGYGRAYGGTDAAAQTEQAEIPEHYRQRIHEAVVKFGEREFGKAQQPEEPMLEGRVYGRPRPQPPQPAESARRDSGVFTIKLYSPAVDTGKTLRIGDHVIPLEEDGSILAGMPDGTVRRITFDQDVMDEMVARGEVWMEGDEPKAPHAAEKTDDTKKTNSTADTYGPQSKGNPALVAQLKADLERRQQQMLDMVRDMLGKQGKAVSGDNIWRTLASGNFQVDAKTKAEAQKNIAEDGFWGVEQTSDRIVQFAIALAGSSPEMLDKMEAAFEKGYAEAEKKWGGALPSISQQTRSRVHEKFAELRKQQNQDSTVETDSGSDTVFATIHLTNGHTAKEETEA